MHTVSERQLYHLYTDASFEQGQGGAGGILFERRGLLLRWFSEWHDDVRAINPSNKKGLIFELELAAVLIASADCAPAFGVLM